MRAIPRLLAIFLFIVFASICIYCGYMAVTTDSPALLKKRAVLAKEWLRCAKQVSRTKKARAVVDYVSKNSYIAQPLPNNRMMGESKGRNIALIPLLKRDRCFSWAWDLKKEELAHYCHTKPRMLVIRADMKLSSDTKGLILLHEGVHAYEYSQKGLRKDGLSAISRAEADVSAYTMQFENMKLLYGERYVRLVQKVSKKIDPDAKAFVLRYQDYQELEEIMAPAISQDERLVRVGFLWMQAVFYAIDHDKNGNKWKRKVEFMRKFAYSK